MHNQNIDDFADACYDTNTAEELKAALGAPQDDFGCLSDCREWGLDYLEWREAIQDALGRLEAR